MENVKLSDISLAIAAVEHLVSLLRAGAGLIEAKAQTVDWITSQTVGELPGAVSDGSGAAPSAE
jgi:hypothetical protein